MRGGRSEERRRVLDHHHPAELRVAQGGFRAVTGACALVQERAWQAYGEPLSPLELREVLITTGHPQPPPGGHVGPAVDLAAALATIQSPWTDLGQGLAGAGGMPVLIGVGKLGPDSDNRLETTDAAPSTPGWLVAGFAPLTAPFLGGTLIPQPTIVLPHASDATGKAVLPFTWPVGLPPGTTLYAQAWFTDATGPQGATATNGLSGG